MSNKRLDRREQRRAEARVRQAAFDAEVDQIARASSTSDALAREIVRGQHNILHRAAARP